MTASADHPLLGRFIRPVPSALYCFQVIEFFPEDDNDVNCLVCKRFGYDPETQRPVQDGIQSIGYLKGLKQVADGVLKDEWPFDTPRWMCVPLYWRRMEIEEVLRRDESTETQLSLF